MSTAQQIVETLGGHWNGNSGQVCCPAHDDFRPSLSVKEGDGGRVLVKCHAGCEQDAVIEALHRLGLWTRGQGVKGAYQPADNAERLEAEAERQVYAYRVMRVALKGPKLVREYLESRDIIGKPPPHLRLWTRKHFEKYNKRKSKYAAMVAPITNPVDRGWKGAVHVTFLDPKTKRRADIETPRLIYGPAKGGVIKFFRQAKGPILIAEGIEDALSVHQLTGCEAWSALSATNMPTIATPTGRDVIICADNDAPGREAADKLAERLAGEGKAVAIALPLGKGTDWNDALYDKKLKDADLGDLILDAEPVEPLNESVEHRVLTEGEFVNLDIPPRENLIAPILPCGGLAEIYAWRGIGKTYVALGLAFAVSRGADFLRWTVERPGSVLYVDGEMRASDMQERFRAFQAYFDEPGDGVLTIMSPECQPGSMPDIGTEDGRRSIDDKLTPDTRLIILDSLSTLMRTGDENTAEDWRAVQEWLLRLRADGRSVIFVHHSGKSGEQRGTSAREDPLDTVINLRRPKVYVASDGAALEVHFEKSRGFYGEDAESFEARMTTDENGVMEWTTERIADDKNSRVVEMLKAGTKQKEIAGSLGMSEGRVSQIKKKAQMQGLLGVEKKEKAIV